MNKKIISNIENLFSLKHYPIFWSVVICFLLFCFDHFVFSNWDWWKNTFDGFSTEMLGAIATLFCIQFVFDKHNEKDAIVREKNAIMRANSIIYPIINRYEKILNHLIWYHDSNKALPPSGSTVGALSLDLKLSDLEFIHVSCSDGITYDYESFGIGLISVEKELLTAISNVLQNVDFVYNEEIKNVLVNFVEIAGDNSSLGMIERNQTQIVIRGNDDCREKVRDIVRSELARNGDAFYKALIIDRIDPLPHELLNASLHLRPYSIFYIRLLAEKANLNAYRNLVHKLQNK
jgi:hypothetical protein